MEELGALHARSTLTWVAGLPGSGKTSLVARWLEESRAPAYWHRLEHDGGDGAGWFDALHAGLAKRGAPLPGWSPENQGDLAEFSRRFFAELAREPLTLVLDDCHRIADDATLFTLLASMHEVSGSALRVVLISRRGPPPCLSHGVVGGWLSALDDLRLREDELAAIALAQGRGELAAGAEKVLGEAQGWLAHVLALCRSPSFERERSGDASERVGDFLAAELLASVPEGKRAALRHLAELPEIPRGIAGEALVGSEVQTLLTTLAAQHYFVDATPRGGARLRLHDLLRDALLRRNAREDSPEALRRARLELAEWVSETMPEASMALRAACGDTPSALALLELHGAEWFARGLHRTVLGWLAPLPEPELPEARAALALFRARALLPLEPEAARPLFATARRAAVLAKDATRAYLAWCGEVESYVLQWGAVHGLADLVDDLELLLATLGPPPGDLGFRTSADALTALMYGRAEDLRISRFAHETARAVAHAPDAGARVSAAAQLLIYKLWWEGDFPGGRALYDSFDAAVWDDEALPALPRLLWWSCAAIVDWQCGDPAQCYRKVERGLALADASGVHLRDFFLLTQGIFCALNEEDWPRAEQYLTRLARTERGHKRLDVMVHHFFRSWYSLSRGDARTALAHAESAWPFAEAMGSMFHKVIVLSALAPARVHVGDLDGAERAYREQLALAKSARNPTFSFIAFCAGAELSMARGDLADLKKQVERLLLVKSLGGFHSICGWRTPVMRSLLAFALANDVQPEIARQWIRQKRVAPPQPVPPGWPMRVQIETDDGLSVLIDGAESAPAPGGKSPRKLRELLALLAASQRGAASVELGDWLWPDAEGDKAAASLKSAVHRLRQWLGADAIRVEDGRVRLNPEIVGCDLWQPRAGALPAPERVLYGFDAPPLDELRKRLSRGPA